MHPHSKAQIPQVIIIPRHPPFISAFTKLLGQVAGATKKFQQPAKSLSKQASTPIYPLLYLSTTFFLSPHQSSSIPHHHSRRLFLALHNTSTKRKASPCIVCSSNGEIPAVKMMANKTKSKPQKHVVFTPVK
jgi:3-deoxy-D-manno-octulosonic-acid transferase